MKPSYTILALLFTVSATTAAQVVPAVTSPAGSAGLPVSGTLHYDLRLSQTSQFGYGQDGRERIMAFGDASYANTGKRFPFSMQYGCGYGWTWAGSSSPGNNFQSLSLSQGMNGRSWNLSATDNVNYTFETLVTGFSGATSSTDQTVLALNSRTLDNTATIGIGHRLDYASSLNIGGSSGQMRFIDGNGQDMNTVTADAGISHRLDARDSVSGQYSYSRYSYNNAVFHSDASAPQVSFSQTNTMQLSLSGQWNAQISTSASVGPQWISSSNSAVLPSSTRISASASFSEAFRCGTAGLFYSHGTTGGSGYMLGAETDDAGGNFTRRIGKSLNVGLNASYMRTAGLIGNYATKAKYGGAQATWQLGKYLNTFASYTAADQSSSIKNSATILNGLDQSLSFGVGYSPREVHLRK
jgi:hypothetical protein